MCRCDERMRRLLAPVTAVPLQPKHMFDIMHELLLEPNFDNKVSITTFVRETVSSLEAALISSGTASSRLMSESHFHPRHTTMPLLVGPTVCVLWLTTGLGIASLYLGAQLSQAKWMSEQMSGLTQLHVRHRCLPRRCLHLPAALSLLFPCMRRFHYRRPALCDLTSSS
jgi:Zn-dependent M16 (insulinase) family peptidase